MSGSATGNARESGGGSGSTHPGPTYRSASARARAFDDALAEAMSTAVPPRFDMSSAAWAEITALADEAESKAAQAVTAGAAVRDANSEPYDRDRVEHERQARLRRWQALDPRERKP